jgi:hypothetical protein
MDSVVIVEASLAFSPMLRLLFLLCSGLLLLPPCRGQEMMNGSNSGARSDATAMGSSSNQQSNASASNSFGGNNNSYQYNTEFGRASEYTFSARQLRCEGPRAFVGVWADPQAYYWYNGNPYGANSWEMRGGAGVTVPFGTLNETCKQMSRRLEQQLNFDTSVGIVRACAGLRRSGVVVDEQLLKAFPDLVACRPVVLGPVSGRPEASPLATPP